MCDPASLALTAAAVSAIGGVYSGAAANAQGIYEQRIAQQNRGLSLEAAADARQRGEIDQMRHYRRVAQQAGDHRARQAASGLDLAFGSPLDLQQDIAMIGGEDAWTLAENTRREVKGYEIDAANFTMQGKAARSRGKAALIGSVIQAGATLLGGAQQVGSINAARAGASIGGRG